MVHSAQRPSSDCPKPWPASYLSKEICHLTTCFSYFSIVQYIFQMVCSPYLDHRAICCIRPSLSFLTFYTEKIYFIGKTYLSCAFAGLSLEFTRPLSKVKRTDGQAIVYSPSKTVALVVL